MSLSLVMGNATEDEVRIVLNWVDRHPDISPHVLDELNDWVHDNELTFSDTEGMIAHFDYVQSHPGVY